MAIITATDMKAPQHTASAVPVRAPTPALAPEPAEAPQAAPEKPAEDPMAAKFAALARQQKEVRAVQRQIEQEKAAIAAEKAEIEKIKGWREKFGSDPWSALIEAGYTPEQATQVMLNQPASTDVNITKIQNELRELKAAQERTITEVQEAQKQQYEQAKKQIGNEVRLLVDADSQFETVKAMNAQDAVTELIEQSFNETGHLMSVEEAAKEVEEYLVEEAMKLAQLGKIKSRLAPQPEEGAQKLLNTQKPPMTTLTNRQTAVPSQPMTAKDRRARAIAAFMGQQK